MAVFERDRGSRRFYSLSSDIPPQSDGGIPAGSMWTHTDTGDRFIFNGGGSGEKGVWLPFVGVEDVVDLQGDILECLQQILRDGQIARASVATMANDQSGGDFPTTDE